MINNYNKLIAFVLLALISVSSQALLYKNEYFVWTYFNVAETNAGMGELAISGLKALSRTDTAQFWNSGEPNNSGSTEHCVTQTKNGGWNDAACNTARQLACFNGTNWAVSPGTVNIQNNVHSNLQPVGCPAGYSFAAPMTVDQKLALDAVIPNGGTVWINGFDNDRGMYPPNLPNPTAKEGVWVFNRGITNLFGPNWAAGQPVANSTRNCASINSSGQWTAESCSAQRALVCARQDFGAVQIINANTAYTNTEDLHKICRTQVSLPGEQWMLAAPRSSAENAAVVAAFAGSGVTGSAWLNASGNRAGNTWQTNLDLTNWAAGEPNFSNDKQCVVARASDGKWQMADCDSRARLLCSGGDGVDWLTRNAIHQFSNQAVEACSRPNGPADTNNTFSNYQLITPITEYHRYRADVAVRGGTGSYWLNLKYLTDTQTWLRNSNYKKAEFNGSNPQKAVWYHTLKDGSNNDPYEGTFNDYYTNASLNLEQVLERNKGVTVYFVDKEPNGSDISNQANRSSCIQLYGNGANAGLWDDTRCDNNSKRFACFDGFEWAVSPGANNQGPNQDASENVSNGHNACAAVEKNGVTGNFVFATPRSFAQSQKLLTVARDSGAGDIWINVNSKKVKRAFVFNLGANVIAPFWNPGEPNNAGAGEDCAVQQAAGNWNDLACTSTQRVACYSPYEGANGTWKLTAASYTYTNTTALTTQCENEHGSQYKFYAPETLSQMRDLKAVMVTAAVTNAYINANDIEYEGTWVLNQGINNWAAGQTPYANDGKSCVSANASDAQWRTRNCGDEYPVACYSGGSWSFTKAKVKLNNFSNAQAACTAEFGQGYLFQAPRSLDAAEELKYGAELAGVGGDYWINGNSLETHTAWKWNQYSLKTPIWGAGQPAGGKKNSCALLNNNTQGSWSDALCDQAANAPYLCRNGNSWQASTQLGNLQDFSTATAACSALGSGWVFAAPTTYNENVEAKNAIALASISQVWLNATDTLKEGVWVLNSAPASTYPNWAATLPAGNCAYQSADGKLHTIDCNSSEENAWSCTDGSQWRVTTAKGKVGSFSQGHKVCLKEFGSEFVFAAPLSKNDAIQLDFARLLTATETALSINKVWLNMTTGGNAQLDTGDGRKFRRNLPFTNWNGLLAGKEPSFDKCAYKGSKLAGVDNPWIVESCTGYSAHYACTNGSQWRVATSQGIIENGVIQIVPTNKDYWSYERGNSMCKEQFGGSFYFSAPVTAAEELALDATIRTTNASVKRVWLNTYSVNSIINGADNKWFVNRLHLGVWQKPEFRNYNNSDCAVLHKDGSWTDVSCNNNPTKYAFACFNGEWSVQGSGDWEQGFEVCDNSGAAMFAVPRTPDEMAALQSVMGADPVWINLTDTAFESQWIANRLRFTWWAAGEPSNVGNRDCARVRAGSGEWYAGKCSVEAAPYACRTAIGNTVSWNVTTLEGIWSDGFGACEREFPGSLFMAPNGFGTVSAKNDQDALYSVINTASKDAWLNLSDQDVEGSWRPHRAYADWGTQSLFDENKDCAYLDRNSTAAGTWLADSCKYTAGSSQSRGYACTDGYQWKTVNETPTTNMRWSNGFDACSSVTPGTWRFAAPTNAFENTKLKLVMELHGTEQSQIWINAHDRFVEGEWQVNGPETNFAPTVDVTQTAVKVAENSLNIQLKATLEDDEEQGIASASWSLISNKGARTGTDFTDIAVTSNLMVPGANGSATLTAQYSTPVLFKEDRLLTFKVTATDIPPGTATPATAETFVNVRVVGPLVAAWDFNDLSFANKDITGHEHNALNNSTNPLPAVAVQNGNGVLKLESASQMVVLGKAADPANGLEYPAGSYTLAFRMSIESPAQPTDGFRGILQKGDTGGDRQPGLSLVSASDKLSVSQSITLAPPAWPYRDTNTVDNLKTLQWINVIYVESSEFTKVYVDGVEVVSAAVNPSRPSLQNDGNFYVGDLPHVGGGSFVGFIDDIHIFNRELSLTEIATVLPTPPLGSVEFEGVSAIVDEFLPSPSTYEISLERSRGDKAALTVYVDFDPANSTATKGTLADMATASNTADFAFVDEANYVAGKGIPVTWAAGEKGLKTFSLKLDNADDAIREGTETARFIIKDLSGAQAGSNDQFNLRLTDLTPNPYGNFSVSINGFNLKRVPENTPDVQEICFVRESGVTGDVTLNYQVGGSAVAGTDYTNGNFGYAAGSIIPTGTSDSVTFVSGDNVNKCIRIQPFSNPTVGQNDVDYTVEITAMNAAPGDDPLLTENTSARVIIYDWSPGTFKFSALTYSCKEPNDRATVPDGIRATEAEKICQVAVERTNTGGTVPAATLNVVATNRGATDISYTYTTSLTFPAFDPESPTNPDLETQYITFNIADNNSQDENLIVDLQVLPTAGEDITSGTAELTIIDVTEPAIVKLSRTPAIINEGGTVTYTITRTGNSATWFSFDYGVTLVPTMPEAFTHYFDTSGTNGKENGTLSFTKGGANTQTLAFKSINTIENNADFVMDVLLDNPQFNYIVGFGDLSNANGFSNNTALSSEVNNTRDLIADNYEILFSDTGTDSGKAADITITHAGGALGLAPDYFTAYILQVPTTRQINMTLKIPKGKHIDDGGSYTWKLLNEDGTNATWSDGIEVLNNPNGRFAEGQSGSLTYDSLGINQTQDFTATAKLNIPFVVKEKTFRLQLDVNANTEIFSKVIQFKVKPLYRRLQNDANSRCLRGHDTNTLVGCGNPNQWPDIYWTWHSEKSFLISLYSVEMSEANKCIDIPATSGLGTTNATIQACVTNGNRIATLHSDKTFRIDNTLTCRYALNNDKIMRKNGCSDNNDRKWTWLD